MSPGSKRPVVSGYHGKNAGDVEPETLELWKKLYPKHGVALRLWKNGSELEVIGIDIDHYDDKKGYDTYLSLVDELGELPKTWISTARGSSDLRSGIRFFCVPAGLEFHDIGNNIDVISRGMRFTATWPTIHPGVGAAYRWYNPDGVRVDAGVVPSPWDFPELPQAWVDRLTRGRQKFYSLNIDLTASVTEVFQWAAATFPDYDGQMCKRMKERFEHYKKELDDCTEHHGAATKALWNMASTAFEGHRGAETALDEYMEFWVESAGKREKRDLTEAFREMGNSHAGALRKMKGQSDKFVQEGQDALKLPPCNCAGDDSVIPVFANLFNAGSGDDGSGNVNHPFLRPPDEYDTTDDGNADHLVDAFLTTQGSEIRYITDRKTWIFWNGEKWCSDNEEGGPMWV